MTQKFTAEEVRAEAADYGGTRAGLMLNHLAEHIEADERAVLGTCALHGDDPVGDCRGCAMTLPEKDFTRPPAQAAQVDDAASLTVREVVERLVNERDEALAKLAAAEPVAQPHSPDAADSGRVGDDVVAALAGMVSIVDSVTQGQERERREEWLPKARAALAAQGQGAADLAGYVDTEQVADMQRNGGGVLIGSFSERYGRTVPVYFHPAPPASPAGVPDVVSEVMAELEKAIRKFPTWPTDPLHAVGVFNEEAGELSKAVLQQVYEPHKNATDDVRKEARQAAAMALRFLVSIDSYDWTPGTQHEQPSLAAPSAPEGDGGGK